MKGVLNNALVHFALIGMLLYWTYSELLPPDRDTILIDQSVIEALVKADQEVTQIELTPERKQSLIENYIDEEVLLREAFSRELHKSDYRVRKRLLGLMRSSLTEIVPEPSIALLRAYYDENKSKFMVDEALTFETVRFPFNSNNIPEDAEQFIQTLQNSKNPLQLSESNLYGNKSIRMDYQQTAMQYGRDMAEAVFKADMNDWEGPLASRNEVIYFRVIERHDAFLPEFEKIESYLRDDYYFTKSRELQQSKIDALRAKYNVKIEGGLQLD